MINEAVAVIPVKGDSLFENRVVVGRKIIRYIRNRPGETKATFVWKLMRNSMQDDGMTLNMQNLQVNLILIGRLPRSVQFFKVEGCLQFATAFYNSPPPEIVESVSVNSSVRLESLNHEEQAFWNSTVNCDRPSQQMMHFWRQFKHCRPSRLKEHPLRKASSSTSTERC